MGVVVEEDMLKWWRNLHCGRYDGMKTLINWKDMAGEQGRMSKMALGYLAEEMVKRQSDGALGEYVILVRNKFAAKNCTEKQSAYATFHSQRRHVFTDRGSMCEKCSTDKKFMLALIMRNIATFKHAK